MHHFLLLLPLEKKLPPECTLHLIVPPINFNLTLIHVLVNPLYPLTNTRVLSLALLQHFEHQITADTRIIGVAKMLVDTLLERFNALAQLFGVVRMHQLLED